MKPFPSSEPEEQDQEIIELLKALGTIEAAYPPNLLQSRRAAFLTQLEALQAVALDQAWSDEDQELVRLLGHLKDVQVEYPADLFAARRSALLRHVEQAETVSLGHKLRAALQRIFEPKTIPPTFTRLSLVLASLAAALFVGSLVFSRTGGSFRPVPSPDGSAAAPVLPTDSEQVAILNCPPQEETDSCPAGELSPDQDLANAGNGLARPAVSKDARAKPGGADKAAYVNDGRAGASWVSTSPDSWIKIDLGRVTTINTVSLQRGSAGIPGEEHLGQFAIAVALSDTYADGDSSNDYQEYAQVFHSEQTGFSGTTSGWETVATRFPPVQARYVKISFEKAGVAIQEVGVFMVRPPVLIQQPTKAHPQDSSTFTATPLRTGTSAPTGAATLAPTSTRTPVDTAAPALTNTLPPTDIPTLSPTDTLPPPDTATPVPTEPPSETPIPLPTAAPPTDPPPVSTDPIVVTGNDQNLTFTCNGNAAEIRGHANTVILLGSCNSITVTGNGNRVFWESGSPVITNRGRDNIIEQL